MNLQYVPAVCLIVLQWEMANLGERHLHFKCFPSSSPPFLSFFLCVFKTLLFFFFVPPFFVSHSHPLAVYRWRVCVIVLNMYVCLRVTQSAWQRGGHLSNTHQPALVTCPCYCHHFDNLWPLYINTHTHVYQHIHLPNSYFNLMSWAVSLIISCVNAYRVHTRAHTHCGVRFCNVSSPLHCPWWNSGTVVRVFVPSLVTVSLCLSGLFICVNVCLWVYIYIYVCVSVCWFGFCWQFKKKNNVTLLFGKFCILYTRALKLGQLLNWSD